MVQQGRQVLNLAVLALFSLAGCLGDDSAGSGLAICEQAFRVDGENLQSLGAGCGFYGGHGTSTFVSDVSSDPDLKVVATQSRSGLQVIATSHGVTVAKAALSESQLETGEKLIIPVKTLDGDSYEFRYWGSRTIDPAQYMDGIDAGMMDGGLN